MIVHKLFKATPSILLIILFSIVSLSLSLRSQATVGPIVEDTNWVKDPPPLEAPISEQAVGAPLLRVAQQSGAGGHAETPALKRRLDEPFSGEAPAVSSGPVPLIMTPEAQAEKELANQGKGRRSNKTLVRPPNATPVEPGPPPDATRGGSSNKPSKEAP